MGDPKVRLLCGVLGVICWAFMAAQLTTGRFTYRTRDDESIARRGTNASNPFRYARSTFGWFVGGLICLGIALGPWITKMSWLRKALNVD